MLMIVNTWPFTSFSSENNISVVASCLLPRPLLLLLLMFLLLLLLMLMLMLFSGNVSNTISIHALRIWRQIQFTQLTRYRCKRRLFHNDSPVCYHLVQQSNVFYARKHESNKVQHWMLWHWQLLKQLAWLIVSP